jgi:glyoxylase-like metal-dependent hydrolase (beta-lactamase superfamily II)
MTLQILGDRPVEDAARLLSPLFEHLAGGAMHPIFFAPCVQMVPLKTVALPPSAYTNAYLIGSGPRYLLDPGADEPAEQERLFGLLDEQLRVGQTLTAIVLTHHHPDHTGAAAVCAKRFSMPIWAHRRTAEKLQGRVPVDRQLNDGDRLDLGPCPADGRPWFLETLHTPGHASGHLTFFEPFYRLLFVGDMVSTVSSVVIAPPDGDMAEYLQSLRRMRALPSRMLLPAHGNVSAQPAQVIDAAIAHRAKREQQLVEALAAGPVAIDELTAQLYRGTPDTLMRFARAQVLAGLLKLQQENRARPLDAERWQVSGV